MQLRFASKVQINDLFNSFFSHSYNVAISFCTISLFICSLYPPFKEKKCKKHACTAGNKKADIYDINVVDEAAVISLGKRKKSF